MDSTLWLRLLRQHRVIAVIRAPDVETGWQMAQAVYAGGIRLIEITWNSVQPRLLIQSLRRHCPDGWIGAGTLLSSADMREAIAAGAQFGFSPHTDPALMQLAQAAGMPMVPGALTPTEIVQAWQSGASVVKVFPISTLGGSGYIRSLQGPMAQIPLLPTGGVTVENAADLLSAGAIAVGLSSSLFPQRAIAHQDWLRITTLAQTLLQTLPALAYER